MVNKAVIISKKSEANQKCSHYWIIETPSGPISGGVCKFCGATREFKNYLRDCLEVDSEEYKAWLRGAWYEKEESNPEEGIVSQIRGGDKDAVTAGT